MTLPDFVTLIATMMIWFGLTALYFVFLDLVIPPAGSFSYKRRGGIRFVKAGRWTLTLTRSKA